MGTFDMHTLPNVNIRRGGNEPSHIGFASDVSPEVQGQQAENSHTGVTSNFVSKENHHWFVFRALYGHVKDIVEALKAENVEVYVPMHYEKVDISGNMRLRKMPLLPGLVFAYMTRKKTLDFVRQPAPTARYMKYYTDKTKEVEAETGHNPPITIPDAKMNSFINICETKNEHIMTTSKDRCRFKSGDKFKVVSGEFKGVVGQVVRAAGQQRIAVELQGIGYVLTAYIPTDFLEKIEETTHEL